MSDALIRTEMKIPGYGVSFREQMVGRLTFGVTDPVRRGANRDVRQIEPGFRTARAQRDRRFQRSPRLLKMPVGS